MDQHMEICNLGTMVDVRITTKYKQKNVIHGNGVVQKAAPPFLPAFKVPRCDIENACKIENTAMKNAAIQAPPPNKKQWPTK